MADDGARIVLDFEPNKSGCTKGRLAVKSGGKVLHCDIIDLAKDSELNSFVNRVKEVCPGVNAEDVRGEILSLLSGQMGQSSSADTAGKAQEVDVSRIVRPHLFHLPEISGLLTWRSVLQAGRPVGQWVLCVQWQDGRRQSLDLAPNLEMPDGAQVWFHPMPGAPQVTDAPLWTSRAKHEWLNGYTPAPAEVFKAVAETIAHYLDFPSDRAAGHTATLALWTILSYVYTVWPAVPYLRVGGAYNSGKSRTFEVLGRLVYRPLMSSNMTAACLFRTLHNQGGTLLLDEAEQLRERTPEASQIRSILLSGYKAGSPARRLEKVGDRFVSEAFDVFGLKGIAGIGGLSASLASRCITVMMFRCPPGSPKPSRRLVDAAETLARLRDDLHAFALTYGRQLIVLSQRTDLCAGLNGRDYEVWQPIHVLAKLAEDDGAGGLLMLVQEHARQSIAETREEPVAGPDETLLRLLADTVRSGQQHDLTPEELLRQAQEQDPTTFKKWTAAGVGRHLGNYGIRSTRGRRRTYRNVTAEHLQAVELNYGLDLGMTPEHPSHVSTPVNTTNAQEA